MRDLDEEFNKLVEELRARIEEKKQAGDLDDNEATILSLMVEERLENNGWNSSSVYC